MQNMYNGTPGSSQFGRPVTMPKPSYPDSAMKADTPPTSSATPVDGDEANFHETGFSPESAVVRKKVYIFSANFPQAPFGQYPAPPLAETEFWQMMNKEMDGTRNLALTTDPVVADYRVELRCGGVLHCSKLTVDVKTPERNPLTSFSMTHFREKGGFGSPKMAMLTHELAQRLDERIRLIPQGGYGYSEE